MRRAFEFAAAAQKATAESVRGEQYAWALKALKLVDMASAFWIAGSVPEQFCA